jgi:DNA-directed RNA polymerase sigma subunit (sigma70/sigma32)
MSLEETGQHLDLTRERIRQIRNQALRIIKARARGEGITDIFG